MITSLKIVIQLLNIWNINNCPTFINTNLTIVDWLNFSRHNKSFYTKLFGNVLEKVILWVIWTHKNNIMFNYEKYNPIYVLELRNELFMKTKIIRIALTFLCCQKLQELIFLTQVKGIILKSSLLLQQVDEI